MINLYIHIIKFQKIYECNFSENISINENLKYLFQMINQTYTNDLIIYYECLDIFLNGDTLLKNIDIAQKDTLVIY